MWRSIPAHGLLERELLKEYLFFDLTLGRALTAEERRCVFLDYLSLFALDAEAWEERLSVIEHELMRAVTSAAQLKRTLRAFSVYEEARQALAPALMPMLSYKQTTIERRDLSEALRLPDADAAQVIAALETAASEGHVASSVLLAFLSLTDRLPAQDREENEERLWRAVRWNSPMAILLAIRHFPEARRECAARMHAAFVHRGEREAYSESEARYKLPAVTPLLSASALEDAFERGVLSRESIHQKAESVIASPLLTEGSKCSLLLLSPDIYPEALLLGVKRRTPQRRGIKLCDARFPRPECENVAAHFASDEGFGKALWLSAHDDLLLEDQRDRIIKSLSPRPHAILRVSEYTPSGFYDALVRAFETAADASPLLILDCREPLSPEDEAILFPLLSKKNAKHLELYPSLAFDFSEAVFVILSRERPPRSLAPHVDPILFSGMSREERERAYSMTVSLLSEENGVTLNLSKEAREALLSFTSNRIKEILSRIVADAAPQASELTVTEQMVRSDELFGIGAWRDALPS